MHTGFKRHLRVFLNLHPKLHKHEEEKLLESTLQIYSAVTIHKAQLIYLLSLTLNLRAPGSNCTQAAENIK